MRPLILLGGLGNALALARSIGKLGARVYVLSTPECPGIHSKYCAKAYSQAGGQSLDQMWTEVLLENPDAELAEGIIIACNDEAISFIHDNAHALGKRYRLEENDPALRFQLLDKQHTLKLARSVGLSTPGFWTIDATTDLDGLIREVQFPILVKPIYSHVYSRTFKRKLTLIDRADALRDHLLDVQAADIQVMLCEFIPGPDSLLCSYYTYINADGECLFDFTKRILRRQPKNFGGGCYHITDWNPEVAEAGRRFFTGIKLRGLGNIEFKRDPRDQQLKVIECNPRFTAAHQLLVACGMDICHLVYAILNDQQPVIPRTYKRERRLIYLRKDFRAYRELVQLGELTFAEWLLSVLRPHSVPVFSLSDPGPSTYQITRKIRRKLSRYQITRKYVTS